MGTSAHVPNADAETGLAGTRSRTIRRRPKIHRTPSASTEPATAALGLRPSGTAPAKR